MTHMPAIGGRAMRAVRVCIDVDARGGWRAHVAGEPGGGGRFDRPEHALEYARSLGAEGDVEIVLRDAYHRVIGQAPAGGPPRKAADTNR